MDNSQLQSDEIEALSAIYGNEWIIENNDNRVYSITLKKDDLCSQSDSNRSHDECERHITIELRLPSEYPLDAPPFYTLSAPYMSRKDKTRLMSSLEEIYCQNAGQSIIYMWIEKAREFLNEYDNTQLKSNDECQSNDAECPEEFSTDSNDNSGSGANKCQSQYHHQHHHHHASDANNVPLYHGEPFVDRRSTFQAHLSPVHCVDEALNALALLKSEKKLSTATHNISAYRISGGPHNTCIQDCDDDGENHAGSRLLHLLQILDVRDVLVVVSRWYGGIQLGPDRFKHINNAARELLQKCGYFDSHHHDESSQSGKSKKKSK